MTKFILHLVLLFITTSSAAQQLNVMTFNIRFNNPGDSLNAWPYRADKAISQVLFHQVHLMGVQEALHEQMLDMEKGLKKFKWAGVARKDGKQKGEYSAIFYDTTRLRLLETATFWLSESPDSIGKKGWDAAFERIVTWAKFRDLQTKKVFYHFNTHFDHIGKIARKESAKLLLSQITRIAGKNPVVVTGDFNAQPMDEPIRVLLEPGNRDRLTDTKEISSNPHYGPEGTFNAFGPKEIHDHPIDYIFIKNGIRVLQHASLSQTWQGRFSSDHFPVLAVLQF